MHSPFHTKASLCKTNIYIWLKLVRSCSVPLFQLFFTKMSSELCFSPESYFIKRVPGFLFFPPQLEWLFKFHFTQCVISALSRDLAKENPPVTFSNEYVINLQILATINFISHSLFYSNFHFLAKQHHNLSFLLHVISSTTSSGLLFRLFLKRKHLHSQPRLLWT